ncbi:ABC transporter ATP-binding protein [Aquimarina sp. 2201CG14-23]|uniref:ABC transporter ATP-binding protein n=1 Tax=Aquimarina mycalae TaxID=3040073 RepID=UPI0024782433|nr:ABC transporter ATP-binding protein [Aquimarina sp. 2201CG14-23]MDH7446095.1 ABC transporter ATP-binding protein [Aquimarina sp. 2201CG14-23]
MMTLEIKNVSKRYAANKFGLKDYSLTISSGILGLLGPNGAGKSTLLKIISTISKPSEGTIFFNQKNIVKKPNYIRNVLGYLPQEFGVYPNLNAYEFLEYIAAMKGVGGSDLRQKIERLIEETNLSEVAKSHLSTYSGGMIQRIGIAQALLNDPKILILDEPTVGLDPEERLRFRDLISELSNDRIIILSSHIVSDIETIADQVVIMNKGQLITKGTQEDIMNQVQDKVYETVIKQSELKNFKNDYKTISSFRVENGYRIRFISENTTHVYDKVTPTLEDAYIYLNQK